MNPTTTNAAALRWTPLTALASRFTANVDALAGRDADLADQLRRLVPAAAYFVASHGNDLVLGTAAEAGSADVHPLPTTLPAGRAAATATALCPTATYREPILIAGEDLGWLWDRVYRLPCDVPTAPGHRPPLYLILRDLERLWVMLHLQDWPQLLADPRVRLFAGPDAVDRLGHAMTHDYRCGWPHKMVTADPAVWPAGASWGEIQARAAVARAQALAAAQRYAGDPAEAAAVLARLRGGGPLRVLGVTSRYTTFLQHSMRDWLAAFEDLGHHTQLLIEEADHELAGNRQLIAHTCDQFRPDLIVIIDHFRGDKSEYPAHVPVVMWVQDRLPHIFSPAAGANQGPLDFCMGLGRLHLSQTCGYPAERFMTCPVGTNIRRFAAVPPTAAEMARFGCDVSYVSHASATAEQLVDDACRGLPAPLAPLLADVLGRMRAHYARDPRILSDVLIRRILADATTAAGLPIADRDRAELLVFLGQQVNNAIVRHDALLWLSELGVDLRLYGRGWDRHPQLARFARGVADNSSDLSAIYRCSAINLQVTPFGCVHQRMLDGLSTGAFFLARWNQGDAMGVPYRHIWDWCQAAGIGDDAALHRHAPPDVRAHVARVNELQGFDMAAEGVRLFDAVRTIADSGFSTLADAVWGDDYDRVAFGTRADLHAKVTAALADPAGRRAVAGRMRDVVIARFSYREITRSLLGMIRRELPATRPLTEAA